MKAKWLILLACMVAASGIASASLIYDLTDGSACSGGCGTSPFGTVTLVQTDAFDVSVTVSLNDGFFIQTGGPHETFAFNITGGPPIAVSGLSANFSVDTSFSGGGGPYGNFDYGINGPAPSNHCCDTLTFSVSDGAALSIANFIANSSGYLFEADIYGNATGNTGEVGANGACVGGTDCGGGGIQSVPEPFSLLLTASGLLLVGLFRRKIAVRR